MRLYIKPTLDNVQGDLGYNENDEVNIDSLLFQQGFDIDMVDVDDDERFEIPVGFVGEIDNEEESFFLKTMIDDDLWDKEEIFDELEAGIYLLEGDTITLIKSHEF